LCEKNKKNSVQSIFESLLNCKRNEDAKYVALQINVKLVARDVDFLINTKKFKNEEKTKFVRLFCDNNWKYIRELNRQYHMRSSMNLEKLISKHLGSGSGYLTLCLLKYSIDPIDFYCNLLNELGAKFDKNKTEIARIFLSRSELDLNAIREQFAKKQYGKELDKWVEEKSKNSKFGFFLIQILTSIDRYNAIKDAVTVPIVEQKTESVPTSPTTEFVANDSEIMKKEKTPKPKYGDISLQDEILNDDTKKAASLEHLCSDNNGFLLFLSKYLKSKSMDKVWNKLASKQSQCVEMSHFPDLITFVLILYKVKIHQQKTGTKTKPAMDNKEMRASIEHLAIWIVKNVFVDEFKLTKDEFMDNFGNWCEQYIEANK